MDKQSEGTPSAEVSLISRLLEAGSIDTLYRDLYLERAHALTSVTGWAIGANGRGAEEVSDRSNDASSLYEKLEQVVAPLFYRDRDGFIDTMRHAIALNGSFFNTHRMVLQYVLKAYLY